MNSKDYIQAFLEAARYQEKTLIPLQIIERRQEKDVCMNRCQGVNVGFHPAIWVLYAPFRRLNKRHKPGKPHRKSMGPLIKPQELSHQGRLAFTRARKTKADKIHKERSSIRIDDRTSHMVSSLLFSCIVLNAFPCLSRLYEGFNEKAICLCLKGSGIWLGIIRECLSYCNTQLHRGTLYRAANFTLLRTNAQGIATYTRPLRRLTESEREEIARRSTADPRARRLRATRWATQAPLFEEVNR